MKQRGNSVALKHDSFNQRSPNELINNETGVLYYKEEQMNSSKMAPQRMQAPFYVASNHVG